MENIIFINFVLVLTVARFQSRVVRVPEGPLVRVEGQTASVRCDVSDYEGPREQDFEWTVDRGGRSLQLVSSFQQSFPDPYFADRVASGDIAINRLSDDAVELSFRELKASDGGNYTCSTLSTDIVITGNYDAAVWLTVIRDSLRVAPMFPPAVVLEGNPLEIHCNVTREVAERTYLSVTWSLSRGGSSPEDILTFGPDSEAKVGSSFAQRYADGGLRVVLLGGGAYAIVLSEAHPNDQGGYACTAQEWVPEEGGVWQSILERRVELGQVEVTPTAKSLMVFVEDNTTLNLDDTLNLTCSISTNGASDIGLEVTWLVSPAPSPSGLNASQVLVHVNRDGTATSSSTLTGTSRLGANVFRLVVPNVDRSHSGSYSCMVRVWIRQSSGEWYQAAEKTSDPVLVQVTLLEPEYRVVLRNPMTPSMSGEPMELDCQVTDVTHLRDGRLSVTWQFSSVGLGVAQPIVALDEQGHLLLWDEYRQLDEQGLLILSRIKPLTFKLRLLKMRDLDRGTYSCVVSAWARGRDGSWTKSREVRSDDLSVQWVSKNPKLGIIARRLREVSSPGATFEMSCEIKGENLQDPGFSVLIQVVDSVRGKTRRIVSLSPDSVLQLEEWNEPNRQDGVVLEKTGPREFRFRLYDTQVSDQGFYSCNVTAWRQGDDGAWSKAASAESNKVQIAVVGTGPAFNVSIRSDTISIFPGETTKIDCLLTVLGASPNIADDSAGFLTAAVEPGTRDRMKCDVSYEVQWYLNRLRLSSGAAVLASVDRWGVVTKSPRNGSSDCSLERMDTQTFRLSVHQAQDADTGEYHCVATPWLLSSSGTWTRGQRLTSATVFLAVKFAVWDSIKLPLLYGTGAAVTVGLLSLFLGFLCSRCWCRNVAYTPRSDNHLMSMDME